MVAPARKGMAAVCFLVSASLWAAPFPVSADDDSSTRPLPASDTGAQEGIPADATSSPDDTADTADASDSDTDGEEVSASDSGDTYILNDDIAGGDCIRIGVWIPDERRCVLAHDVQGQIVIATSSLTVDGSSFTLLANPDRGEYPLIKAVGQSRVAVQYLAVDGADIAISFNRVEVGQVRNVTFARTRVAVDVEGSDGVDIENSSDTGTDARADTVGVRVTDSTATHVISNEFSRLGTAILVRDSSEYTLQQNVVRDSGVGFDIYSSSSASVWQNFFYRNGISARATDDSTGRFFALKPLGGNHWDTYDQPSEGCADSTGDGYCDRPYIVNRSEQLFDNLPYATTTSGVATTTTICSEHCASSVIFIPGTESSRLYMRDLFGVERQLWEPSLRPDVPFLAMNPDGTSKHEVYTKDIIDTYYGNDPNKSKILNAIGKGGMVYGDFENFMDGLVASGTIASWLPYPYDWRRGIQDIAENGTLTELPDGTLKQVYLEDLVESLASEDSTTSHKVTIIAHSNGGLIAKALIRKLAADDKAGLVDRLIMIGVPQWGTPKDIGSMLHGDGMTVMGGLVMYGGDVRETARDMPGPYALLPSSEYFLHIGTLVTHFAIPDDIAFKFAAKYPAGIKSFPDLVSFITNAFGLNAGVGSPSNLNTPLALRGDLIDVAKSLHDDLDHWTPPEGIAVTSIVGWGQLTPSGYNYQSSPEHLECESIFGILCSRNNALLHTEVLTEGGDGTVVSPSAAGDVKDVWYFNAKRYGDDGNMYYLHQFLTSAHPVQQVLLHLLNGNSESIPYTTSDEPPAKTKPLIRISALSPVNLIATDAGGDETGLVSIPGKPDIYFEKQEIPGSTVQAAGEEKFLYLPANAEYSVSIKGYAEGEANIRVEDLGSDGETTRTTTLADVPITTETTASFSTSGAGLVAPIEIDEDGDGAIDSSFVPETGELVSYREDASTSSTAPTISITLSIRETSGTHPGSSIVRSMASAAKISALAVPAIPLKLTPPAPIKTPHAGIVPTRAPIVEDSAPTSGAVIGSSQPASAYAALSPTTPANPLAPLYHWLYAQWLALISLLSKIL